MNSKYNRSGPTERSGGHRRVEKYLNEEALEFESEKAFPPYTVDIYFPEWHIALEIDGPFHGKNKDYVRDEYLRVHYGLIILRMSSMNGILKAYLLERLIPFIENNADTGHERKALWRSVS